MKFAKLLFVLFCTTLAFGQEHSELSGTWSLSKTESITGLNEDPNREIDLTFGDDGQVSLETRVLTIMFVETTEGECIAHTKVTDKLELEGTYRWLDDKRLLFHWNKRADSKDFLHSYFSESKTPDQWHWDTSVNDTMKVTLEGKLLTFKKVGS